MKTIITADKANQPYGYPQLDANGNIMRPTPAPEDFSLKTPPNTNIFGAPFCYVPALDTNYQKFDFLADYTPSSSTDYLTFQFEGGWINNNGISYAFTGQNITVNQSNVYYRDDGYGSCAANYVDFVNTIFASHSLYTRVTGSNNGTMLLKMNYCKTDNFIFIFRETGYITNINSNNNNLETPMYYVIGVDNRYLRISDKYGGSINDAVSSFYDSGYYWSPFY